MQALKDHTDIDIQATDVRQAKGDQTYASIIEIQPANVQTARRRCQRSRNIGDTKCQLCGAPIEDHDNFFWGCTTAQRIRAQARYKSVRRPPWTTTPPQPRRHGIAPVLSSRMKVPWWEGPTTDHEPGQCARWGGIRDQRHTLPNDYLTQRATSKKMVNTNAPLPSKS